MAKRLSEKQKGEIIKYFTLGKTIDELSIQYGFTNITITKYLKKNIDEKKYMDLIKKSKSTLKSFKRKKESSATQNNPKPIVENESEEFSKEDKKNKKTEQEFFSSDQFMELTPLTEEIDNIPQKDLSSVSISDVKFPKIIYMVVDKQIELEIKYLRDYPEWLFLSEDELNRKTIEIFEDLKIAKRFCNKEQRVIKVPNTEVFKIVAPVLISRGISRIVKSDTLIAL